MATTARGTQGARGAAAAGTARPALAPRAAVAAGTAAPARGAPGHGGGRAGRLAARAAPASVAGGRVRSNVTYYPTKADTHPDSKVRPVPPRGAPPAPPARPPPPRARRDWPVAWMESGGGSGASGELEGVNAVAFSGFACAHRGLVDLALEPGLAPLDGPFNRLLRFARESV